MATNCQPIRDQIGDLETEIEALQELLPNATPAEKADIIRQVRENQSAIRTLQQGLRDCLDTIQIQAILVSDDDGSNPVSAGSTIAQVADQIKQWIAKANSVYAPIRLQFQFEGNDNDVLSIRSTLINNLGAGGLGEPDRERAARAAANLFPFRAVVFFRTVTGPVDPLTTRKFAFIRISTCLLMKPATTWDWPTLSQKILAPRENPLPRSSRLRNSLTIMAGIPAFLTETS